MGQNFNYEQSSTLICDENTDVCFDDLDFDEQSPQIPKSNNLSWANNAHGSQPFIHYQSLFEGDFGSLLQKETQYLPQFDYLARLRCGELDSNARMAAFDWIRKVHSYYSFGPLSLCLAVNYLDRFLSSRELPGDRTWGMPLLAIASLSIAVKMEEPYTFISTDLQIEDPQYTFETKTIQRMELLILDTLKWKMNAVTPCSFVGYSFMKLGVGYDSNGCINTINKTIQIILCTLRGIEFLEFKPSEIAAAVAILILVQTQAMDITKAISCFHNMDKGKLVKCVEMLKGMSLINRSDNVGNGGINIGQTEAAARPYSPSGVLDLTTFSFTSDDLKSLGLNNMNSSTHIAASTSITNTSPEHKRVKLDTN